MITNTITGAYTYTPNPNAFGTDSFTFKANDGLANSKIATISVNIAALNDAPVANNGTLNTSEDSAANGTLSANDVDGNALSYSIVTNGGKGTVAITNAATGTYTYTPNLNATGSDSFTFKVFDGLVNSNTATITVNIAALNDAPVANNGNLNTSEDSAANGTLSANDVDGNALSYSIVTNGGKGTVAITYAATGTYTYTPNLNATGSDSFTFKANDGLVNSNTATITVNIAALNDAPVANNGSLNTSEDSAANGTLSANDVDGNALSYSIVSNGSKGTVAITNTATGTYTYTPNLNATGSDSFTFKVYDGLVNSNTATITVNIAALNDAPVANNGSLNTSEDSAANCTLSANDVDGNALSYSIVSNGSKGTVAITNAATGTYTYTPNLNATGSDSFTFKAYDGLVNSNTATITVNIAALNDAPVANNGSLNTSEDSAANGTLSANDVDGNALSYSIVSNGSKGTVAITNAATGTYTYTPNLNATGSDSFTFKANDGLVNSNMATITVNIAALNDAPVANNGSLNTSEDSAANGTLSANDVDGNALSYSIVSNGSKGTVAITNAATGTYTYTPNLNATGSDSFTFKVFDGLVYSNTATITVNIAALNDAPVANNGSLNTSEDSAANGTLSANDVDGNALSYSIVSNGSKGTVAITNAATGTYTYTPNLNATGSDSFTFKVFDGLVNSNTATITVNIAALNDAPVANNGTLNTSEDSAANGTLSANDVDGNALSYSIVSNGSKGTVAITNAATGTYTYTPNLNASGSDSFTFNAYDGLVNSNTATITVNIAGLNDAPVANDGNLNTNEDVAANGVLSATDVDSAVLTYSIVNNGTKGTAVITNASTGAYTYTPNAGTSGADSFTFKVNDDQLDSNIATITVNLAQVNDAPIANNGSLNINEDVAANGVLSATDVDSAVLTYSIVTNGSKGTAVITNAVTGAYIYTPNPNATGSDSFTFKVNDGQVDSNIATVGVSIAALNDAPIANNGTLNTNEDNAANGILSASDVDGNALTYSIVTNGGKGSAVITNAATGAYTYTPTANAIGGDSFTFKVNDGQVDSGFATITVNIAAVNDAPIVNNGNLNTFEDVAANGVLSATDGDGDALTFSIVTNASKGTAVITNAVTGAYTYTPNFGATGVDSFTFKVNDGLVDSSIATITVNITLVNVPPLANASTLSTQENNAVNGTLMASDGDGDTLVFSIVSNGLKGTAVITNPVTGAYTYTPNPGEFGADSFSFKVSDGLVYSNTAIVSVNITQINTSPVAMDASLNVDINAVTFGVFSASDADGDVLTYSIVTNGEKGVAVITNATTGDFSYTSNMGATGTDRITFKVNDGLVDSNSATVDIQLVDLKLVNDQSVDNASGGSLNFLFSLLMSLLPGLRMVARKVAS